MRSLARNSSLNLYLHFAQHCLKVYFGVTSPKTSRTTSERKPAVLAGSWCDQQLRGPPQDRSHRKRGCVGNESAGRCGIPRTGYETPRHVRRRLEGMTRHPDGPDSETRVGWLRACSGRSENAASKRPHGARQFKVLGPGTQGVESADWRSSRYLTTGATMRLAADPHLAPGG